jgi:hypothetical protein
VPDIKPTGGAATPAPSVAPTAEVSPAPEPMDTLARLREAKKRARRG